MASKRRLVTISVIMTFVVVADDVTAADADVVLFVPVVSPSRGWGVGVGVGCVICVKDINQPSLPTSSYSVLVPISVSLALSTVFHSINSPDNSPLSHSVLPVLILPYWSFQLYTSFTIYLSPDIYFFVVDWA